VTSRNASRTLVTGACALALAFAGTVLVAGPASAAPLAANDEATLIAAINTANGNGTADVITLGADIALTASLPPITEDLEIVGTGFTLDGGGWASGYTVFSDVGATANITLVFTEVTLENAYFGIETDFSNVTITDSAFDDATVDINGNGVTIDVSGSVFDNVTDDDGLYVSVYDGSTVSVSGSSADLNGSDGFDLNVEDASSLTVSGNSADENGDNGFEITVDVDSTATIEDSTADNNEEIGIDVENDSGSTATIDRVIVNDNGDEGVGVEAESGSTITVSDSSATGNGDDGFDADTSDAGSSITFTNLTATGNESAGFEFTTESESTVTGSNLTSTGSDEYGMTMAAEDGSSISVSDVTVTGNDFGGILVDDDGADDTHGTVTIVDSTLADNSGSGLDVYSATSMDVMVRGTTISGNSQIEGGGIYAELYNTSSLTVINSTISGNEQAEEGAIFVEDNSDDTATVTFSHSTIVNNTTLNSGDAGGMSIAQVNFLMDHTIVAGNTSDGAPSDLRFDSSVPAMAPINYSLVQNSNGDALTAVDAGTSNLKDMSALLGSLADNGGPTLTHLPQDNSPVVGAGNPAITGAPATDQRGQTRIVDTIDLGAVELQPALAATGVDATFLIAGTGTLLGAGALLLLLRRRHLRNQP